MDKKLFGSIITVLILLSCLWVFARYSPDGTIDNANMTTNGTITNWTSFYENTINNKIVTINFSINPNFTLDGGETTLYTYNITNITIGLDSDLVGYFNLSTNHIVALTSVNVSGVSNDDGVTFYSNDLACSVTGGVAGVQCLNASAFTSNISGNATIFVWFYLAQNKSTGLEDIYNWDITVLTNDTTVSGTKTLPFGVDDLAPRLKSINITDGRYVRTGASGDLNFTKEDLSNKGRFLNISNINVTIILTEYNRDSVQLLWGWNGTKDIPGSGLGLSWNGNETMTTPCVDTDNGENECLYSAMIEADNFTDGQTYSFLIWANDSFNQRANLTNSWSGFNITFDNSTPSTTEFTVQYNTIFSTNPNKIKCLGTDATSYVTSIMTLTKPSGKTVEKAATIGNDFTQIFENLDTNEAGTYTVDCRVKDTIGLFYDAGQISFQVFFSDIDGPPGEEGVAPVAKVDISTVDEYAGIVSAKQGQSETFTLDGTTAHTITFIEIGITSATFTIESDPIEITLDVGQYRNVDLDGDGTDDIKVTLTEIDSSGLAKVEVINLAKEEEKKTGVAPGLPEIGETKSRVGLWITILVILVIIGVGYFVLTKKKGKKGEVKFSRKDLGI